MIARSIETDACPGRPAPYPRLVHAVTLILRAARARADDLGWSVWRWYNVRRSVQVLSGLDDHMLSDIGVSRSTIIRTTLDRLAEEEAIRRRLPW